MYVTEAPKGRPSRHRRIIALLAGRVFYSVGANHNRSCTEETMQRWIRRRHARLTNEIPADLH